MKPPKLYHNAKHTVSGAFAFIYKVIKGLLLSGLLIGINKITEYFLGTQVFSYLATIIIIVIFTIYSVISHFTNANFLYLIGWIGGLLLLYEAEIPFLEFDVIHLSLYIGIPTIMFAVRFIMYLYSDREEF